MPVSIREATDGDSPAVEALFRQHLSAMGVCPDAELDADMTRFPESYSGAGDRFVVAELDGVGVVGMAGVLGGEIRRLHVRAEHRGLGIARLLVEHLLKHGRTGPDGRFRARVALGNVASQRVFEAFGFRRTGCTRSEHGGCEEWERTGGEEAAAPC